jgi:predicted GIY-YIG superfamily endonuclease
MAQILIDRYGNGVEDRTAMRADKYPKDGQADAIRRETNLKRWKRDWKIALIEKVNPGWKGLIENWHR